ncbi:MAG: nucleotide exchange factor GrpE [Ruminococcus sp.]|nr:nucleotide exchange factor GrpE [Ruminococcus sp.]
MAKENAKESTKNKKAEEEINEEVKSAETTEAEEKDEAKEPTKEEKLAEELKKQKDSYMRLAAEYDNYRKRTQQEKLGIYDDATAKAVEQLLPMADALQMAIQNAKDAPEEFTKGLEMIQNQFKTSMEKLKVESFGEIGDEFDPNLHNAISKIDSEELGENQLSAIYQKGFKIGDKIIRHAMVQVANCD